LKDLVGSKGDGTPGGPDKVDDEVVLGLVAPAIVGEVSSDEL